jgi:hypothetical protein
MRRKATQNLSKILLIAAISLLAGCPDKGDVKVHNVEAENAEDRPGLIRRDKSGKIETHVTWKEAHKEYGCLLWDDIDAIIDGYNTFLDTQRP